MHSYEEVEKAIWSKLSMGLSFSMPVPVKRGGGLLDVVFTHSVKFSTREPNEPRSLIEADLERHTVTRSEVPESFDGILFAPEPLTMPVSYEEKTAEAKSLYAEVREEATAGKVGPASQRYAELVWSVAQRPLRPYYRALSPALFAHCQ